MTSPPAHAAGPPAAAAVPSGAGHGPGPIASTPTPLEVATAVDPAHAGPGAGDQAESTRSAGPAGPGDAADRVVAAVLAVPGVVRMHAGVFGEVATYLPGRAVTGVRLRSNETEVHLVVSTTRPIPAIARDVHEAVRALAPGPVRVFVEDVESSSPSLSAL